MPASDPQLLPPVVHTIAQIRAAVRQARTTGQRVGVVPTMGALHEGHLSLVAAANRACGFTAVTIFVNPTQFGPKEDFAKYPRTLEADRRKLAAHRVDAVFAPAAEEMYPAGFSTYVDPPNVATPWEGECRPGHFRGVATVVLKLFQTVPADVAYFGQKDYQQCAVIRRMVQDLNVPTEIEVLPTVREPDGLAMSSRNVYLSPEQRQRALALSRSLQLAQTIVAKGERDAEAVRRRMLEVLEPSVDRIDYVAIVDPDSLVALSRLEGPAVALVAVHIGATRLIDNCRLPGDESLSPMPSGRA